MCVCVCVCVCAETKEARDEEREEEKVRRTDRQTDRQTQRQDRAANGWGGGGVARLHICVIVYGASVLFFACIFCQFHPPAAMVPLCSGVFAFSFLLISGCMGGMLIQSTK